jgi:outer membrane protein assembly factor BamB
MPTDLAAPLAVVPIFVNAGAALVPTLVAGLTSILAILLKPKELLALFRRKPWLPVAAILVLVGLGFGLSHLLSTPVQAGVNRAERAAAATPAIAREDWTKLALKLLQEERDATKASGVKPLWDYSPDATAMTLSSPAYSARTNRVYATAAIQDVASFFGVLYAVDANTGRELWKTEKAGDEDLKAFFSSPTLSADEKHLVVGQGLHEDENCSLICVDTETGAVKWSVKTPLHIESSPAIRGDLAVVGAGAIEGPDHKPRSHAGYVFAVQISTGKQLWRHDVADPESSPAIAEDGAVYIGSGFNGNAVVALRGEPDDVLKARNQTRELWRTKAPYPITGPVTLHGDLVLVGGGNSDFVNVDPHPAGVVLALDRKTGAIRWQTPTDDSVLSTIVVSGDKVFCPVRGGSVIALNLVDGKPLWKQGVHGKSPLKAGLAVSPDGATLFAATSDGHLALLSATDGKPIEKHPLNNPAKPGEKGLTLSTPTLAGDKLFVGSETGGLRAFQMITSKPQ